MVWIYDSAKRGALSAVIKEIESDTDRSAAIVAAAFVEDHSTTAIRANLHDIGDYKDSLFGGFGPLAPFGVKTKLAAVMGLITEDSAKDLSWIRNIRNKFAHDINVRTFDQQPIKDWAMNLTLPDRYKFEFTMKPKPNETSVSTISIINDDNRHRLQEPRGRYTITCSCFLAAFTLEKTKHHRSPAF